MRRAERTGSKRLTAGRLVTATAALLLAATGCRTAPEATTATTSTTTAVTTSSNAGTRDSTTSGPTSSARPRPSTTATDDAPGRLPAGPVTLITLGDSLTEGDGDETEQGGYPGRLLDELTDRGHPGSELVNLGRSGWDSTQLIEGQEGAPERPQLTDALAAARQAKDAGRAPLVLLLIGSNDLWYLYGNDAPTSVEEERDNLDRYRANLDRIVGELTDAGATVVVGINDDQSHRPVARDPQLRGEAYPAIDEAEVAQMSKQAVAYAAVVREVAGSHGALVADFLEAPFFRDRRTLADDGNHPNAAGYDEMTEVWLDALAPLLG